MNNNWLTLNDIRTPQGALGRQGFTVDGVNSIANHVFGINVPENNSIKDTLTRAKQVPQATKKYMDFLRKTPVQATNLPDNTVHLEDGHHRAFIADQLGFKRIPKQGVPTITGMGGILPIYGAIKEGVEQGINPMAKFLSNMIPWDTVAPTGRGTVKNLKTGEEYKEMY